MQNLVAISHAVCTHVGGPKNLGTLGSHPLDGADLLETRSSPRVIIPYLVALGQTAGARVSGP